MAYALVRLRNAMIDCRDKYAELLLVDPQERQAVYVYFHDQWGQSVFELTEVLREIGPVLEVFAPDASRALLDYEILETEEIGLGMAQERLTSMAISVNEEPPRLLGRKPALDSNFEAALRKLDAFIQTNFKIEEIYRAG